MLPFGLLFLKFKSMQPLRHVIAVRNIGNRMPRFGLVIQLFYVNHAVGRPLYQSFIVRNKEDSKLRLGYIVLQPLERIDIYIV